MSKLYTLEDVRNDAVLMQLVSAARKVAPGRKVYVQPKSASSLKVISVEGASFELCTLIGKELDPNYDIMLDDDDTYDFGVVPFMKIIADSLIEVTDI